MPCPQPSPLIEWAKAILSVVTAATAVFGVLLAKAGLYKWREETAGKRRLELAEEVLADFYQARDIIRDARWPCQVVADDYEEGASTAAKAGESEEERIYRNRAFMVVERLKKHNEFFARLYALRYRFRALFGDHSTTPFEMLYRIRFEIVHASASLMEIDKEHQANAETLKALEAVLRSSEAGQDEIAERVDALVKEIEAICRKVIAKMQ